MVTYSVSKVLRNVLVLGNVDAADAFRFRYGVTPLSAWYIPILTCLVYYAAQRAVQRAMLGRTAPRLRRVLFVYNLALSAGSAVLFAAMSYTLYHRGRALSLHDMLCSASMHEDGRLQLLYWLNYVFKFVELADTFFLALRKKKIIFLHSYHHAATLLLCWSQLVEHSTVQWAVIYFNLGVHVLMYYYYGVAVLGYKPWWRQYLTRLQIVQFVVDLAACIYAYSVFVAGGYDACYGTKKGAFTGIAILASYLLLFVKFYADTYKMKKPKLQ